MKAIKFKNSAAQKVYADYMKRMKRMVATLPSEDQADILMEFNSHIYESTIGSIANQEVDDLMDVIQKLGSPEEVLKPMIAERKLIQATKSFNPFHVFKALLLNIGNGISYIFFALLYLILFAFLFTIIAKMVTPDQVGLFFKDGSFRVLGSVDTATIEKYNYKEVLGNWFIPVMTLISIAWYLLITFLLRLLRPKK